jgi:hypothetical protein
LRVLAGCRKGGALEAAEKRGDTVILSEAKNLALSIFRKIRRARSFASLRVTIARSLSAASLAPSFQTQCEKSKLAV